MKYKLKSVKFWFAVFIISTATLFLPTKNITSSQWVEIVKYIGNGYLLANVVVFLRKRGKEGESFTNSRVKLKSVKFWFAAIILLAATVFLPLRMITSVQWVGVMKYLGNGYFLVNVLGKLKNKKNED